MRATGKFVTLQTASGVIRENRRIDLPVGKINKHVVAVVLDGCPNVQRCLIEMVRVSLGCGNAPSAYRPRRC